MIMHGLAVLALALRAVAAPLEPDAVLVAARAQDAVFECNPPFPKAPYRHVAEAVQNMDFYFPIDANNKPITTSTGNSGKRQESIDDKLDFLGKQRFGENAYENSGRRATENPDEYEVEPNQCMYITAVGRAGMWICKDSKEAYPISFDVAAHWAGQAIHHCAPKQEVQLAAAEGCAGKPSPEERLACYDEALTMSAQVFVPGGWNLIIRKNDGIAPAMPPSRLFGR